MIQGILILFNYDLSPYIIQLLLNESISMLLISFIITLIVLFNQDNDSIYNLFYLIHINLLFIYNYIVSLLNKSNFWVNIITNLYHLINFINIETYFIDLISD